MTALLLLLLAAHSPQPGASATSRINPPGCNRDTAPSTQPSTHICCPRTNTLPALLTDLDRARAAGYEGVAIGVTLSSDPDLDTVTAPLLTALRSALKAPALKTTLRIGPPQKTKAYLAKANGEDWQALYLPPRAVWDDYVRDLKRVRDAINKVCAETGVDPINLTVEPACNELGVGGAGGPYKTSYSSAGPTLKEAYAQWRQYLQTADPAYYAEAKRLWLSVMPTWTWTDKPLAEGHIAEQYAPYLRYIRGNMTWGRVRTIALTCEAAKESFAEELKSVAGPDWQRYCDLCSDVRLNLYARDARLQMIKTATGWSRDDLTPEQNADRYAQDARAKIACAKASLILPARIGIMEGGERIAYVPAGQDPAACRLAILKAMREVQTEMGLVDTGWFLMSNPSGNLLNSGFELVNADGSPVGAFLVGPTRLEVSN